METNINELQKLIKQQEKGYEQQIKELEMQLSLTENQYQKVVQQNRSLQQRCGFFKMQLGAIKNLAEYSADKYCRIIKSRCEKALK